MVWWECGFCWGFRENGVQNVVILWWICGESVVECMAKMRVFPGPENAHVFSIYFEWGLKFGSGQMAGDALRGRRSLRDAYTPSAGPPDGWDQDRLRPSGGPYARAGRPSGRTRIRRLFLFLRPGLWRLELRCRRQQLRPGGAARGSRREASPPRGRACRSISRTGARPAAQTFRRR